MENFASKVKAYIPIILTTVLWGSMGVPASYAVQEVPPLLLLAGRSLIAVFFLCPLVLFRYGTIKPFKGDWLNLFLLGILGVLLNNYLYFWALQHTTLTNCAILFASSPIMTALLAALFLKEPLRQSRALGMVLAFGGVVMLLTRGRIEALFSSSVNLGDVAQLLSAFCASMLAILGKRIRRTSAECVVLWLMIVGGVSALILFFSMGGRLPRQLSFRALWSLGYLGVLCSCVGYIAQQISVKTIGAAASSAFLNGIPPITLLNAALFLHEEISLFQLACMIVIFAGVVLNARNQNIL